LVIGMKRELSLGGRFSRKAGTGNSNRQTTKVSRGKDIGRKKEGIGIGGIRLQGRADQG